MAAQGNAVAAAAVPSAFGQLNVRVAGGRRLVTLPTGQQACRRLMQDLCINAAEDALAALPSRDITVALPLDVDLRLWVAKVVRRQGYWLAVLVQSRGVQVANCGHRCARAGGGVPFMECVRHAGTQGGACGACIWQSHGAQCEHHA